MIASVMGSVKTEHVIVIKDGQVKLVIINLVLMNAQVMVYAGMEHVFVRMDTSLKIVRKVF
jgi:hypothetical protein